MFCRVPWVARVVPVVGAFGLSAVVAEDTGRQKEHVHVRRARQVVVLRRWVAQDAVARVGPTVEVRRVTKVGYAVRAARVEPREEDTRPHPPGR